MAKRKSSPSPRNLRPRRPSNAAPDGAVWLYGFHAVAAALANPRRRCRHLVATTAAMATPALSAALDRDDLELETAHRNDITERLPPGAVHQGVALFCDTLPDWDLEEAWIRPGPVVVLDQATDPRNVGAVMRSAAALGAAALVVPRRHGPPAAGALAKAASGALDTLPLIKVTNLARALARLQEAGFWCVGFAPDAEKTLGDVELQSRTALVLGAEGSGLRRLTREACDDLVRIPMAMAGTEGQAGAETSLNLSAAAAIALYAVIRDVG